MKVQVLDKGVHSGLGSGIIADSFRIALDMIEKIETKVTGELVPEWEVEIP